MFKARDSSAKTLRFFLGVIIFTIISISALLFFIHPRLQNFADYKPLDNWNLDRHAIGDFDGDGNEDIITAVGCAFLSSVNTEKILKTNRCTARGMSIIVFKQGVNLVGQKFVDTKKTNLNDFSRGTSYAYMGKSENGIWRIYVQQGDGLWGDMHVYEVQKDGLLKRDLNIPNIVYADKVLYTISSLFLFPLMLYQPLLILGIVYLIIKRLKKFFPKILKVKFIKREKE